MVSQKSCKADFVLLGIIQSPDLVVAGAAGLLCEVLHLELEPQLGRREAHLLPTPSQEEGEGEQHNFGELKLPAHLHRPLQRLLSEVSEHVEEHLV